MFDTDDFYGYDSYSQDPFLARDPYPTNYPEYSKPGHETPGPLHIHTNPLADYHADINSGTHVRYTPTRSSANLDLNFGSSNIPTSVSFYGKYSDITPEYRIYQTYDGGPVPNLHIDSAAIRASQSNLSVAPLILHQTSPPRASIGTSSPPPSRSAYRSPDSYPGDNQPARNPSDVSPARNSSPSRSAYRSPNSYPGDNQSARNPGDVSPARNASPTRPTRRPSPGRSPEELSAASRRSPHRRTSVIRATPTQESTPPTASPNRLSTPRRWLLQLKSFFCGLFNIRKKS